MMIDDSGRIFERLHGLRGEEHPVDGLLARRWVRRGYRWRSKRDPSEPSVTLVSSRYTRGVTRRFASISRRIIGVRISCIARSILPPGTQMMFGRDMNESEIIESR